MRQVTFERFGIRQILKSTRCQLVRSQIVDGNEWNLDTVNCKQDVTGMGVFEIEPCRRSENVNSLRFTPQLDHSIGLLKIHRGQTNIAKTEILECRHQSISIRWRRPYPYIQILGVAGMTVRCHGVAPDDQKLNVMSDE